jgi:prepilin-type N-terminal cleavage/methylation domain-containing protein
MLNKMAFLNKSQKGFTLVEMLVAIAISGIISLIIVGVTTQTFTVSSADSNRMQAVKQVENALHWINRDVQMAYPDSIQPISGTFFKPDLLNPGSPLHLEWKDYTDSGVPRHIVEYWIDSNILKREETVGNSPPITTRIADSIDNNIDIDNSNSWFQFHDVYDVDHPEDFHTLTVQMTASVTGYRSATETRTLIIKSRINPESPPN